MSTSLFIVCINYIEFLNRMRKNIRLKLGLIRLRFFRIGPGAVFSLRPDLDPDLVFVEGRIQIRVHSSRTRNPAAKNYFAQP